MVKPSSWENSRRKGERRKVMWLVLAATSSAVQHEAPPWCLLWYKKQSQSQLTLSLIDIIKFVRTNPGTVLNTDYFSDFHWVTLWLSNRLKSILVLKFVGLCNGIQGKIQRSPPIKSRIRYFFKSVELRKTISFSLPTFYAASRPSPNSRYLT